jgi:hypothetical protein
VARFYIPTHWTGNTTSGQSTPSPPLPMTRARADDYGDKKQLILDRAAALFARQGF